MAEDAPKPAAPPSWWTLAGFRERRKRKRQRDAELDIALLAWGRPREGRHPRRGRPSLGGGGGGDGGGACGGDGGSG